MKCYNCDLKEHYVWECHKFKKSQNLAAIKWESEDIKWQVLITMMK